MHKLGFSTGFFKLTDLSYEQRIEAILEIEHDAIEIGFGQQERLALPFSDKAYDLVKQFTYRSIHAPSNIRYAPSSIEIVEEVLDRAHKLNVHTIVVHPDRVDDFEWTGKQFGSLLALENMDWRKTYGKTPSDMIDVLTKVPQAQFVCDVNHIYTWDNTMHGALELHQTLASKLTHYHLSGFGGTSHQCLATTHEDNILSGIFDDAKPIILESVPETGPITLKQEYDYVTERLLDNKKTALSGD